MILLIKTVYEEDFVGEAKLCFKKRAKEVAFSVAVAATMIASWQF